MRAFTVGSILPDTSVSLSSSQTIAKALEIMTLGAISSIVIVDEAHRPVGIFTEHDALVSVAQRLDTQTELAKKMTPKPLCVKQNVSLHDAYSVMEEKKVHHLVVVDEEGVFAGVVSEGDFLRHIGFEHLGKSKIVSEAMSRSPLVIGSDTPIVEAAARMSERSCDYAVVLEENRPEGMITERDVARWYAQQKRGEDTTVAALMRSDFRLIGKETPLQKAAEMMEEHGIHQLIVVDEAGDLIGLLNRHDVLHAIHGAYFEFLIRIIDRKSATITKMGQLKKELRIEKEHFRKSELKLRKLFEMLPEGIVLINSETMRAVEFNRAAHEQLGYTAQEFAQLRVSDYEAVESPEETLRRLEAIKRNGFDTFETVHRTKSGERIDVWVNTIMVMLDKIPHVIAVFRNISDRKKKDEEIKRVQALAHIGTWEWDIERDEFVGSEECFRIYGLPVGEKVSIADVRERVAVEDREWFEQEITRVLWDGTYNTMYRVIDAEGAVRWVQSHAEFHYDGNGRRVKGVGIVQDLTERIGYEEELRQKDADLNTAQSLAHIGSWRLDIAKNLLEWSDETYRIFGIEIGTPLSYESFVSLIHPDDAEMVDRAWQAALRGERYDIEHRIVVEGEIKWVRENARLETDAEGSLRAGVGTVQVITERKLYEKQLERLANYDPLTGLANRSLLLAHLQKAIEKGSRDATMTALFLFDLDRFKDINDSFGHSAGDELLQQVAVRFSQRLREGDLIARLGGDEFAVVLERISRPEDAGRIADEMIHALASSYKLHSGVEIHVSTSIGIVLFPQHGNEAEKLLQHADAALYKAKAEGRGNYRYYTDDLTDSARRRVECEVQLRRAIERGEFEVYYQPQVHIATGRIVGAEALVRWNDPQRGMISPSLFIPLAEETGLIGVIGEWVLSETCRQGKLWLDQGHRLNLAVNLSAHQVRHQNIPAMVERVLKESGYSADRLELELTESALMQREEETVAMLYALRAQGIRLAIDDFGTGYSSLSYLKRFPIDVLKIDKSFIDDVPYDQDDMAIVSAIVAMGQALGFQLLAEGVEREEQLAFLRERGCTMYQGYLKSRPVPAAEFEKLL